MPHRPADARDCLAWSDHGDAAAMARVFDRAAPKLLLVPMHVAHDATAADSR